MVERKAPLLEIGQVWQTPTGDQREICWIARTGITELRWQGRRYLVRPHSSLHSTFRAWIARTGATLKEPT